MSVIYITIDPGKNGAIIFKKVVYDQGVIASYKCPKTNEEKVKLIRNFIGNFKKVYCLIEKVHAMPGNGVVSMFSFGQNFGEWLGILASFEQITVKQIPPKKWQKLIGNLSKNKKERKMQLKEYASKSFKDIKCTLYNADALCMMEVADQLWMT